MRRIVAALITLGLCAGCRDTAENLSRDYRNLNNEAVDALMMITNEASAKLMKDRVLTEYPKRTRLVNDRAKNWKQNAEKTDYGSQLFTSTSVMILMCENEMNLERLQLEENRLKNLMQQMTEAETTARRQAGDNNPIVPKALWPTLDELTDSKGADIEAIRGELKNGSAVIAVLKEVQNDERLLKNAKMMKLKEEFDKKFEEFKQGRILKLRL